MSGMVVVVKRVLLCVLGAEGIGTVRWLLFGSYCSLCGRGVGQSVFTAVSAFCNGGIDLLGEESLAPYVADPVVIFTTMD